MSIFTNAASHTLGKTTIHPFGNPLSLFKTCNMLFQPRNTISRYVATTKPPVTPNEEVAKHAKELDDVQSREKKWVNVLATSRDEASSVKRQIVHLMKLWKAMGYPVPFSRQRDIDFWRKHKTALEEHSEDSLLKTHMRVIEDERKVLEERIKRARMEHIPKYYEPVFDQHGLIAYVQPEHVLNTIVNALEGLTRHDINKYRDQVPVVYGGLGIGKTRAALEAGKIWMKNVENHGRRKYTYIKLDRQMKLATNISNHWASNDHANTGFLILCALGHYVTEPNLYHWDDAKEYLQKLDIDALILHIDEFDVNEALTASVIRGCAEMRDISDLKCKVVPILTGLSEISFFGMGTDQHVNWMPLSIVLSPFEDTLALEKAFATAIDVTWNNYVSKPEYHLLFLATGGIPHQVNLLVEAIRGLSRKNEWRKNAARLFRTVKEKVAKIESLARWHEELVIAPKRDDGYVKRPKFDANLHSLVARIGVMAMLGETVHKYGKVSDWGAGSTISWGAVLDSGLVYSKKTADGEFRLQLSLYSAMNLIEMTRGEILPIDVLCGNHDDDDDESSSPSKNLEAVSLASLYLRIRAAQIKRIRTIPIENLRPGARIFYGQNVRKIEIVVPKEKELKWIGLDAGRDAASKEIHDFKVGNVGLTNENHVALDSFGRFKGELWKEGRKVPENVIVELMSKVKYVDVQTDNTLCLEDIVEIKEKIDVLLGFEPVPDTNMTEKRLVKGSNKMMRLQWPDKHEKQGVNDKPADITRVIRVLDVVSDRAVKGLFEPENVQHVRDIVASLPCGAAAMITSTNELKEVLGDTLWVSSNWKRKRLNKDEEKENE